MKIYMFTSAAALVLNYEKYARTCTFFILSCMLPDMCVCLLQKSSPLIKLSAYFTHSTLLHVTFYYLFYKIINFCVIFNKEKKSLNE